MTERKERIDDGDHQLEVVVARKEVVPRQVVEEGLVDQGEDVILDDGIGVVPTVVLPVV